MTLDESIWQRLEGGYREIYDVSVPLKRLEKACDPAEIGEVWTELWNGLHHQGDVGPASYLALPQIVRIAKLKGIFDLNLLALCSTIEQQRVLGHNPALPIEFQLYYEQGIAELYQYTTANLSNDLDTRTFTYAIGALATCRGLVKLGKAIIELDEPELLDKLIEQI